MRHHRLPLLAGVVALGLALAVASCSVSTSVGSYNVTYRANLPGGIGAIDSVLYSPGTGKCLSNCNKDSTLTRVTNPPLSNGVYSTELFLPAGATMQATMYAHGTGAGTAQFAVIWMTASGTIRGDSVTTTVHARTLPADSANFSLAITKRTL